MHVALERLPDPLHAALVNRLPAAGHEIVPSGADALIVGAGDLAPVTRVLEITHDAWADIVDKTAETVKTVRNFAETLVARGAPGRIVVVIDPRSLRATDGGVAAAVPGAFLRAVAQVAAVDLGQAGIAVNVVAAGWMPPVPQQLAEATPLGRLASPQEIADTCEFLISAKAAIVTGATLAAEGGWTITKGAGGNPLV